MSGPIPGSLGNLTSLGFARFANNALTGCVPHGLRYLVTASEFASGVPAHDFALDANRDGDTLDTGDIAGLALPFCALSQLTLGGLTLGPAFDDGTVAYIASAGHSVTSTTVTATLNNSADGVSITKGTDTYTSGDTVPLAVGVNVITIVVTASDGTTAPHTYSVAVTRAPNLPPVFDEGTTAARGVDENTAANQPIGNPLTAWDADNDTLTYSLDTASDAFFDIDSDGQLLTEAGLDHEARNSYSVNVSVSDGKASDGTASTSTDSTITVTITVENVDEPPLIVGLASVEDFPENSPTTTAVGSYTAADPEGADVTWSDHSGNDAGDFELSNTGVLTFKVSPDYEMKREYEVTLNASDGMVPGSLDVTVTIANVNEPPVVTGNATPSVDENTTAVATYSATDPEGVTVTWSLQGGGGVFMITSAGALAFTTAPNYEAPTQRTVTVRASDGTNDVDVDVTVTVTDVNEDEELLLSARRPFIGTGYTAAFEVGKGDAVQSPMWVWARSMSLSGPWADITVAATAATYVPVGDDLDHYLRVTVSYNDGHGQSAKTLQATSEFPTSASTNMPPVFPSPLFAGGATGLSVDENATAGTVVGLAPQATDPEPGTLDYSLAVTGFTTDPPFEINATSRQIQVADGAVLDHEDQDSYSVTVTAGGRRHRHGNGHVRHHH